MFKIVIMENTIISVGIFFDGAGSNGLNATSDKKTLTDHISYHALPTNIYKLFKVFDGNEKLYVEGIGTITGSEDSDFAKATCKNPTGYSGYSSDDKLRKAYAFIEDKIRDTTKEYQFYVYGFGRGGMLARNFCYELLKRGPSISGHIKIKFLGVFDTVESAPFNQYHVKLSQGVENALHLCAMNECRYFFPLTGFFENSRTMNDSEFMTDKYVWKEIFVPGVHADVGGGYLNSSQSVYISGNYFEVSDVNDYVSHVKETAKDTEENKIWDIPLRNHRIDEGDILSLAYVEKEMVYNDLSKVYGSLMLMQTNSVAPVFITDFSESDFTLDPEHFYLETLYNELEKYTVNLKSGQKPLYDYEKLACYIHISANFGLYKKGQLQKSQALMYKEIINSGLNVPFKSLDNNFHSALRTEMFFPEDMFITDFAYESNIPNNDDWIRSIIY